MSDNSYYRTGSTALVTGASSGIGAEFARSLARRGVDVVLVARSGEVLESLAAELRAEHGVAAHVIVADLTAPGAAAAVRAETHRLGLDVDLLVNNAGFGTMAPFADIDPERVHREMALNISALVELTHAYLPGMMAAGRGAVLNVASMTSFQPVPFMAVYAASKAFVLSFSQALWEECRERGVRVLALCPGPVVSRFGEVAGGRSTLGGIRTPAQVVEPALRALAQGRSMITVGWRNRALSFAVRLSPRRMVLTMARRSVSLSEPAAPAAAQGAR